MLKRWAAVITLLTFILSITVLSGVALADYNMDEFSAKDLQIDPEQVDVCKFVRQMAEEIQQERRTQSLETFPESESQALNQVAEWVYSYFSIAVTPNEVGFGMNSDCVAMFQKANEGRLDVKRQQENSVQKYDV